MGWKNICQCKFYKNRDSKRSILYTLFANPVFNVPPVINSGIYFANQGISNIIIGYKTKESRKIESLAIGSKIFRVKLISRNIPNAQLRKICAVIEFIWVGTKIINRKRPASIALFNEVSFLISRFIRKTNQVHWVLEFPENESGTLLEGLIKKMAYKSWIYADAIIFPSNYRKAMGLVLNQSILHKKFFIIHNSPLSNSPNAGISKNFGINTKLALDFISSCQSKGKAVVVYAGAVGNRYGWDSLIKSIGTIPNRFGLLILGVKHELGYNEFNEAVKNCPFPENIAWIDAIPYIDMQYVIKQADIGFVHYRGDTLNTYFSAPGKLYEYLKAGLAILTDKNACIHEDLEASNSAFTFDTPLNDKNLSILLEGLSINDIMEKKQRSRALFLAKYTFEKQMEPLINFINKQDEQ